MKNNMTNQYKIIERSSGYWIVDDSGVVDCDLTIKQPYHLLEMAQHVLKSLEVTTECPDCDPNNPGYLEVTGEDCPIKVDKCECVQCLKGENYEII